MARVVPGTRVGPYEVVEFIASGGMGEVYRGLDTRLGRSVAIKILPETVFRDREAIRRFDREARAAAAVSHPNLVSIHDVGETDGVHYIVMDFLEGATLRQRLSSGPLPWPEAVEIAIAVTDGVSAMHTKGFVHRDLKPENIFITAEGWVKLLDFGLAVSRLPVTDLVDGPTAERLTQKGCMVGTVAYMSPEQVRERELDGRADLYAVGCVLYEMLSGTPLIDTSTFADMIAAILNMRAIVLPASVPGELVQVVRKCLEQAPERRYALAADLRAALRLVCEGGPASLPDTASSLAVLPFANLSVDKENEYFSDGLSEEILNALTRVPGLRVTARTSAFAFRGRNEDVRRIGEALGVRTILEGSVRRDGNRVRVTAQLVDTASGYHVWSGRYDCDMTDVFAVQDEIATAIVEVLHLRLVSTTANPTPHTPDINAYHAYLKSRYHFAKLTPQRLLLSQALAQEAIAFDPQYPPALAQLAECFIQSAVYGAAEGTEMLPKARAAALRAVALDETEASAHMTLARVAGELDFDWAEALRRCRLALECDRISPAVRALCAQFVLWPLARLDELSAAIRPALAADPLSPMPRFVMAQGLAARGRHDQALEEIAAVLEMHEHFWPAHLGRGAILTLTERTDEAIAALEKGLAIAPWNAMFAGLLAGHYARAGDRPGVERLLAGLSTQPSPALSALGRSAFHYVCQEFVRAAEEYETVIERHYPVAAYYLAWLCLSENFRHSPPGRSLRQRLNLGA